MSTPSRDSDASPAHTDVRLGIVVVAAGSGTRLGAAEPKAFVELGGATLLEHALTAIARLDEEARVVVVAPSIRVDAATAIAGRVLAPGYGTVVAGGAERQDSVAAGIAALAAADTAGALDVVLIHDAARALTPSTVFARVAERVRASGAGVVPALPMIDTVAETDGADTVERVADRSRLAVLQTPQGFPFAAYRAAIAGASTGHTDDTSVFAAAGHDVVTVTGDEASLKITTPWDLRRAELILAERGGAPTGQGPSQASRAMLGPAAALRTGVGIDVHAYDDTAECWLGGLFWPNEPGLAGHSDGDAVSHAICDALLSAAGLGDIGSRFGVDDPRFADARGEVFLTATIELLAEAGYRVENVAVQLVAARPRFAPRRREVEQHLTAILGAPVSVAATTSDGLGFTGRAEGVTAVATALVSRTEKPRR
ncbi:2-C-methyl-D-erythritol 2,4-cyclodiphosphate synthase [Microcella putealis]|uniref:Bifunctional enzyme IspD/IspF n=1 Tax=Microcella putealis TaxID=337005 RepID=A0A4Q7LQV6_9MICO|nr:2-C-methyl-D-erythritol 2,4-cyclodiphosphate synthase [Microcella putealis]RZS57295.1 2-C-methyl-D-erythritol 2,4-cyclodiphosphate synthase [Microcella putealis]TQM19562.1 2-C-methyl-D-erythritol 2,4-cyclodiphosphate synthase [Microcella putealis]